MSDKLEAKGREVKAVFTCKKKGKLPILSIRKLMVNQQELLSEIWKHLLLKAFLEERDNEKGLFMN